MPKNRVEYRDLKTQPSEIENLAEESGVGYIPTATSVPFLYERPKAKGFIHYLLIISLAFVCGYFSDAYLPAKTQFNLVPTCPVCSEVCSQIEYKKSLSESNGWFNVDDKTWEKMKALHFKTRNNQVEWTWGGKHSWLNFNQKESFSCPVPPFRLGRQDGGKIICDPDRLTAAGKDCLVYSIGSNGNFQFENEVLGYNPDCQIHTFDHTWNGTAPKNINYHKIGLGNSGQAENIKSLEEIVKDLGHVDHPIHIFKIDCEGCEFNVYPNFYMKGVNIQQLQIEVHFKSKNEENDEFFEQLYKHGFVMFSKEPNTFGCGAGGCAEYSFLRFDETVFNR